MYLINSIDDYLIVILFINSFKYNLEYMILKESSLILKVIEIDIPDIWNVRNCLCSLGLT